MVVGAAVMLDATYAFALVARVKYAAGSSVFSGVPLLMVIVSVYYDGGYAGNCVELLLRLALCVDSRNMVFVFVLFLSLENSSVLVFIDMSPLLFSSVCSP